MEWLQCSNALAAETTGYLCDALLQWTLLGGSRAPPPGLTDDDHLQELVRLHERWLRRALGAPPSRRLELAYVGRALGVAVRCEQVPRAMAESQWRELVHLDPRLGSEPASGILLDGRAR